MLKEMGYEDVDCIGVGFLARFYKVKKRNSGDVCCVKIIHSDRFRDAEYIISLKLKNKSPNLIVCDEKMKSADKSLFVLEMEYLSGGDLKSFIDEFPGYLSEKLVYNIIKQLGN
jgi:serine/threonine protein kinase